MKRAVWLFAVCACSEPRLLLEIDTPDGPITATTLELILAEPTASARGAQRTNQRGDAMSEPEPEPETETVFYFAQRTRIDFAFDGNTLIDGFEVQLVAREVEAYVPIVVARGADGAIIGLGGVLDLDPFNETTLRRVDYLYDVTRYTIEVEPVTPPTNDVQINGPVSIAAGNVLVVDCDQMGTSGYAWRPKPRADLVRPQLRILLPFDQPDGDAVPRLFDGPDLDCDQHTPQQRGEPGDELDCDDTTAKVFGGPPPSHEVCDLIDNDCNTETFGATVRPDLCNPGACSGKAITCTEDPGPFTGPLCPELAGCPKCAIVSEVAGAELVGCENQLRWTIPAECGVGCVVRLVDIDPRWDVRIGEAGNPERGLFENYQPVGNAIDIAIAPRGGATFDPDMPDGGTFVVMMRTAPGAAPVMFDIAIEMPELQHVPMCPATPAQSICQ